MEQITKHRTPSRCREWERQRRNKFNDAISRLGDIVRTINKANDSTGKNTENVQYPKIEIIQKAIICLTNCTQEITQLKAEILALQVKLEFDKNQKCNKKDASTQVYIGINRKSQNSKYMKLLMLQKSKRNGLKEKSKSILTTNVAVESKNNDLKSVLKESKQNSSLQKLPILLPRSNLNNKKGSENTIVVLPATPYIFPQRQLLFPAVPPAFVLVDSNLQTYKSSIPLLNRNNGDSTKTTMVNILPISAYSRPLSATKTKKNNTKIKNDITKKSIKKFKSVVKVVKDTISNSDVSKVQVTDVTLKENNEKCIDKENNRNSNNKTGKGDLQSNKSRITTVPVDGVTFTVENNNNSTSPKNNSDKSIDKNAITNIDEIVNTSEITVTSKVKCSLIDSNTIAKTNPSSTPQATIEKPIDISKNSNENSDITKIPTEKGPVTQEKDKENKLTNILDTTLCENTVDGGNARLELAEEFLAASPTAAFLMSFPLVSGIRADSPAEEPQNTIQVTPKDNPRRNEITPTSVTYYEKTNTNDNKGKSTTKSQPSSTMLNKQNEQQKYIDSNIVSKQSEAKTSNASYVSNDNPFLNLPMPSIISTTCTLTDSTFGLDFECNINKAVPSQSTSYVSNNNIFYKSDPFSTVKSSIYSTSSISSGHEFNSLGLYPCAMEKYASKNKTDYANVEDNIMKIGSSRLTYDIDLGWSHKSLDFVNCTTTSNTFNRDNILTTTSASYSSSYNPFNPEFHVPLVSNSNKKDISTKPSSSFAETITSFYSQATNLWSEDVPFYTNNSVSKSLPIKHQNYPPLEHVQSISHLKSNVTKQYEAKQITETSDNSIKSSNVGLTQQLPDKYTKKSPNKMHINWMTSEIRPMQNNCNSNHSEIKENHKPSYSQMEQIAKKQDHNESNYFPIHNFTTQPAQEEFQVWPSARPIGTTEISIEPPPINLPTLVGDLALGPHDKKKNTEIINRVVPQTELQNCSNFLSVTQLMNRSTDNMPSRFPAPSLEAPKPVPVKQNIHYSNDTNRKAMTARIESHLSQPCYVFNDSKTINSYENVGHFPQNKTKTNKSDKSSKVQKNSYSAESLIRSGTCSQKVPDNSSKFIMPSQKYGEFNSSHESGVAQVSHFPPILDYTDNSYSTQQFSGTSLYNSTTNTISNSFYSNFMPGSSNLMSGNYTSGPFPSDFIDYNQSTECNYANHKYEELKMRNNATVFHQDKVPLNYKSSRRESAVKHKLECSKKDNTKKYQSKRPKINNEVEEWSDTSHLLWQNKAPTKRHSNFVSEELSLPSYVGNQMPAQYQPDFFNSHLMPSNVQSVGHNVTTFPVTSRANFNLSTIFPEITMKVQ